MTDEYESLLFDYEGTLWTSMVTSAKLLDGVKNLGLSPEDVIVSTYHRSGTTWMKYIAYLVKVNGVEQTDQPFLEEIPYLEIRRPGTKEEDLFTRWLDIPSPRLFTTHLPLRHLQKQLLDTKLKVIRVVRNPKDTLVSYYHFYQLNLIFGPYQGSWDDFFKLFKERKLVGGDVIDFAVEGWQARNQENVLFVTYEEMKKNLEGVIRKVAKFMDRDLSDDVIAKIVHKASFHQMKGNTQINGQDLVDLGHFDFTKTQHIRNGRVGDWRNYFSEEQSKYVDKICQERCAPIGLVFPERA